MRGVRFLHAADIHLGTPFRGLADTLPLEWMERCQRASYSAFARIVDVAIQEQVSFVLLAGDVFDSSRVPMSVYFELLRGFERLRDAGIDVYMGHGNHDPMQSPVPLQWPGNVKVFAPVPNERRPGYTVDTYWFTGLDSFQVQISGFSFFTKRLDGSMAEHFVRDAKADFAIGVYHGSVEIGSSHDPYAVTTVTSLRQRGFDYWALGHIHQPNIMQCGVPTIVYAGIPQGRHPKEISEHGVFLVDVSEGDAPQMRWVPLDTVRWMDLPVDLSDCQTVVDVRSAVLERVLHMLKFASSSPEGWLVRVMCFGQTEMAEIMDQSSELREALQEELDFRKWPVHLFELQLDITPPVDVDALLHSQSEMGTILTSFQDAERDIQTTRKNMEVWFGDVSHRDLHLNLWSDDELRSIMQDAKRRVLQRLSSKSPQKGGAAK